MKRTFLGNAGPIVRTVTLIDPRVYTLTRPVLAEYARRAGWFPGPHHSYW